MNVHRRTFIRATGISLALPWLNAFADESRDASSAKQPPRRMICICAPLGLHPDNFFPTQSGKDYELSPYLDILKDYRDQFTVVSGLAHAGMGSSFAHQASASFLTGAPGAGSGSTLAAPRRVGPRADIESGVSTQRLPARFIGARTR